MPWSFLPLLLFTASEATLDSCENEGEPSMDAALVRSVTKQEKDELTCHDWFTGLRCLKLSHSCSARIHTLVRALQLHLPIRTTSDSNFLVVIEDLLTFRHDRILDAIHGVG